ncbi:MAG: response regulator transcription factor [Coriobacteriia bacterium]|nr:response regulator transcription factor [Coriobacteriia bacterium]MCL2537073.1 response regulator transcription factor [Coriobacteriia bacterium]
MTESARILVIEDDFAIRNSVEFALRREGFEVKSLDTGQAAVETAADYQPDVILLDVMLPGMSGHDICETLRATDHDVTIIMMSALGETDDRIAGLRLGADDYVSKPFALEELLERVRANLRRNSRSSSASKEAASAEKQTVLNFDLGQGFAENESLIIDPLKHEVLIRGQHLALRAKEFALLHALASKPGEVLSRSVLSEQVWGQDHLNSSRTIDVHMRRLRALLNDHDMPDYLQTVHGVGYRFSPPSKS